jgi:hypothetical protein
MKNGAERRRFWSKGLRPDTWPYRSPHRWRIGWVHRSLIAKIVILQDLCQPVLRNTVKCDETEKLCMTALCRLEGN